MPSLRRNEGESLDAWDARMAAAWTENDRDAPAPRKLADLSPAEQRAALDALSRPAPLPVVAPFDGRHLNDLSPHERARAAQQLGIAHLFPTFR